MGVMGRTPKYYFLIYRLKDDELYCAATIARLLHTPDLRWHDLNGPLEEERFKARQSLSRIARLSGKLYEGLVRLPPPGSRNMYPGYRGAVWKQILSDHQGHQEDTKMALGFVHGS